MSDEEQESKKKIKVKKYISISTFDPKYEPLRFIEEVKKRPGLYSSEHPVDRDEKLSLWKEVGAAIFPDWEDCNKATAYDRVLQLQRKWRSLRDAYGRELRARRSGVRVNKCVYRYFKNLTFLGGFEGNISDAGENEESTHEDTSNVEYDPLVYVPRAKKTRKRKAKPPSEDSEREEIEVPVSSLDIGENETDSDKLFLLSFLPEMKQLPLNVKMWARTQIANTMQEAVASYFNNTMPGSSSNNFSKKLQRNDSSD